MMRFLLTALSIVLLISEFRSVRADEPKHPLSAREVLESLDEVSYPNREMLAKLRELSRRDFATRLEVFRLSLDQPRFTKSASELSAILRSTLGLEDDPRPFAIAVVTSMVNTDDDAVFCELDELLSELKPAVPSELLQPAVQSMMHRIQERQFRPLSYALPETLVSCATSQEMELIAGVLIKRISDETDRETREGMHGLLRSLVSQHRSIPVKPISKWLLQTFEKHQFTTDANRDLDEILYFWESFDSEIVVRSLEIIKRGLQRNSPEDRLKSLMSLMKIAELRSHHDEIRLDLPRIDDVRFLTRLLVDHLQEEIEPELRAFIHLLICRQSTRLPVAEGQEYIRAVVRSASVENNLEVFERTLSELSKVAAWLESEDVRVLLKSRFEAATLGEWSAPYQLTQRLSDEHADELTAIALTKFSQVKDLDSLRELMSFIEKERLTANRKTEVARQLLKFLDTKRHDGSLCWSIVYEVDALGQQTQTPEMNQCIELLLQNEESVEAPDLEWLANYIGRMSEKHFQRYWALVTRLQERLKAEPDPAAMSRLMRNCIDRLSPQERQFQCDWFLSRFEEHGTPVDSVLDAILKQLSETARKQLAADCLRLASTGSRSQIYDVLGIIVKMPEEAVQRERNEIVRIVVERVTKSEFSGDSPYEISDMADELESVWGQCDDEVQRQTILQLAEYLAQNEQPYDCQGLAPGFGRMAERTSSETLLAALLQLLSRIGRTVGPDDYSVEHLSKEFDRLSTKLNPAEIEALGVRIVSHMKLTQDERVVIVLGNRLSHLSHRVSADTARESLQILYRHGGQSYVSPSLRILLRQNGVIPDEERRIAFLEILKDPALTDDSTFRDVVEAASESGLFWRTNSPQEVDPMEWKLELVRWARNPDSGGRFNLKLRWTTPM